MNITVVLNHLDADSHWTGQICKQVATRIHKFGIKLYLKGGESGAAWNLPCLQNDCIVATQSEDQTHTVDIKYHQYV